MAVGFGHDAQIQIQGGQGSASCEHDLYIGTVEQAFQSLCFAWLHFFTGLDQVFQTVKIHINLLIHLINFHTKVVQGFSKWCMPDQTQQQVFCDHIFVMFVSSNFNCLIYNVFDFGIVLHVGP